MRVPTISSPIRNRYFFASDIVLLPLAAYLSFVIRLESFNLGVMWSGFLLFGLLSMAVVPALFAHFGVYKRFWRYASLDELMLLGATIAGANLLIGAVAVIASEISPLINMPRSAPVIFLFLSLAVTTGPRLISRVLWRADVLRRKTNPDAAPSAGRSQIIRAMIVGAGSGGSLMLRELRENPQIAVEVVGFIDDDPMKQDLRIHGVPVLGCHQDIPRLAHEHQVSRVIIAMPSAPGKMIRKIVEICERADLDTKSMPGVYELLDGKVSVNQLRDVQIEDLLRRRPVRTDIAAVAALLKGKRVLITGGGGSIGSELCRQVLRCAPAEMIILGHGENSVFIIENELRKQLPAGTKLTTVIADIRFAERMHAVFDKYRPDVVFHAAAHKHVPLMESNPTEAITNNVLGTRNLLNAALAVDVQHFVMISTDKAVNPTSVMGASKRVAELLVHQAAERSGKPYVAVRFGNVLGSRGSVVLTFKQQIAAGGPVTVTHPEMVRFFMTIPEAVQLTLQAATIGNGGEVFTLDMGEPVKIVDLARDMIELSGLEVGRDVDIHFTGMRPGEKLYEELFVPGEDYQRTFHEKIFIACNASALVPKALLQHIQVLETATYRDDHTLILRTLNTLIPSFRHPIPEPIEVAVGEAHPPVNEPQPLLARAIGGQS